MDFSQIYTLLDKEIYINRRLYELQINNDIHGYICYYYNKTMLKGKKKAIYLLGNKVFRGDNLEKLANEVFFWLETTYDHKVVKKS